MRGMTVFLLALILKRDMAPFFGNVLGLKRVMCGKRDPGLSFSTREYGISVQIFSIDPFFLTGWVK